MEEAVEKRWWAYSKRNKRFQIVGYSTKNNDFRDDAAKALELLSKHIGEPIPSDIELIIIP